MWPVIKMIGMSVRPIAMRFCSSRPLSPGREMSGMRQLGTGLWMVEEFLCRGEGLRLASLHCNSRDSRTEVSSPTTNTIEVETAMRDHHN
jgi:hypothetical protein